MILCFCYLSASLWSLCSTLTLTYIAHCIRTRKVMGSMRDKVTSSIESQSTLQVNLSWRNIHILMEWTTRIFICWDFLTKTLLVHAYRALQHYAQLCSLDTWCTKTWTRAPSSVCRAQWSLQFHLKLRLIQRIDCLRSRRCTWVSGCTISSISNCIAIVP